MTRWAVALRALLRPLAWQQDSPQIGIPFHEPFHTFERSCSIKSIYLGAGERIRTADLPFTRRLLCQLSYTGG